MRSRGSSGLIPMAQQPGLTFPSNFLSGCPIAKFVYLTRKAVKWFSAKKLPGLRLGEPELIHLSIFSKLNARMKYTVDKQEHYAVFSLKEENLNSLIAPQLKSEFVILSNEGVKNLIFDLSGVSFVDSSGLSAILTANRLWKSLGSFILTGVENPNVKKLMEISRLDSVLTIIPTVSESIDYIFMEEIERQINSDDEE